MKRSTKKRASTMSDELKAFMGKVERIEGEAAEEAQKTTYATVPEMLRILELRAYQSFYAVYPDLEGTRPPADGDVMSRLVRWFFEHGHDFEVLEEKRELYVLGSAAGLFAAVVKTREALDRGDYDGALTALLRLALGEARPQLTALALIHMLGEMWREEKRRLDPNAPDWKPEFRADLVRLGEHALSRKRSARATFEKLAENEFSRFKGHRKEKKDDEERLPYTWRGLYNKYLEFGGTPFPKTSRKNRKNSE